MPFLHLDDLGLTEPIPGFKGRFVHTENLTVANWMVEAGSAAPTHSHPHEQVSFVMRGEFELTLEGETQVLKTGVVALIPSNAPHSGRALSECHLVDVFYPAREDLRQVE